MRWLILLSLLGVLISALLITACQVKEITPGSFKIVSPANGATNVSLQPTIEIEDSSGVPTTYDVYLDGKLVGINLSGTSLKVEEKLPPDTYHTIRVVRKLLGKLDESSPDITFKTTRAPLKPWYAFPSNNYKFPIGSFLEWRAKDPDGDPVTFDVYIGDTPDNLEKVAENLKTSSYKPEGLSPGKTYYWKVVVKDDKGASVESDIYSFKAYKPDVYTGGPIAYVSGLTSLWIVNLSNAESMTSESFKNRTFNRGVAAKNDVLYVGRNTPEKGDEVLIYDLANLLDPVLKKQITTKVGEHSKIFDNYLIFHDEWGYNFTVYDITDSFNPKKLYEMNFSLPSDWGQRMAFDYKDGKFYILVSSRSSEKEGQFEFKIMDAQTGTMEYQKYDSGNYMYRGIAVVGNKMYILKTGVFEGPTYLEIFDISDSKNPLNLVDEVFISSDYYEKIFVYDENTLIIYGGSLSGYLFDVKSKTAKQWLASKNSIIHVIEKVGNIIVASLGWDGREGLAIYDKDLNEIASYDKHGYARNIIMVGKNIYVFDSDRWDLIIYDEDLNELKTFHLDGDIRDWQISGNTLYVLADKIYILDVSDPLNPPLDPAKAKSITFNNGRFIRVQDNFLFAFSNDGIMSIYDISDPKNPSLLSTMNLGMRINHVGVGKNMTIAGSWDEGYVMVDISDKNNPKIVKKINDEKFAGAAVSENYAYVFANKDSTDYLIIYDISNPSIPNEIGRVDSQMCFELEKAEIFENYLIAKSWCGYIKLYDTSNPANPTGIGEFQTYGWDSSFFIDSEKRVLYVAMGGCGVVKLNLSALPNIEILKSDDWFVAYDFAVVGE